MSTPVQNHQLLSTPPSSNSSPTQYAVATFAEPLKKLHSNIPQNNFSDTEAERIPFRWSAEPDFGNTVKFHETPRQDGSNEPADSSPLTTPRKEFCEPYQSSKKQYPEKPNKPKAYNDSDKKTPELIEPGSFNYNALQWHQDPNHYVSCSNNLYTAATTIDENFGDGGDHCIFARIDNNQHQVVAGQPNKNILIRTFTNAGILHRCGLAQEIDAEAFKNVLDQYDQMKRAGIAVATIYNYDQARAGCGYFIVEFVPNRFIVPWKSGANVCDFNEQQLNVLTELRTLFKAIWENKINGDLHPTNLRRRLDGTCVVVDWREDRDATSSLTDEIRVNIVSMAQSFHCSKFDQIYTFITQDCKPLHPNQDPGAVAE